MSSNCDPKDFLGPYTKEQNLSITDLLKAENFSKEITINNGIVYEIRNNSTSDAIAAKTICQIGQAKDDKAFIDTNIESLRKKVQTVYNKSKLLKRKGNQDKIHSFCKTEFLPPACISGSLNVDVGVIKSMQEVAKDVKKENVSLKRGIEDKENKINELNIQIDNFENFITTSLNVLNQIQLKHRDAIAKFSSDKVNLEKETNKWQTKFESVSKTLDETTIKLDEAKSKLSKYNTRNVNKRQKRLENKFLTTLTEIQELKNQCEQKDNEINDVQESLEDKQRVIDDNLDTIDSSNQAISQLKSEKHKLQKRICSLKINSRWSKCSLVNKHEEEIATLKEQVHMNNNKISELEQLNILLESDQVLTFENGRYINEVRACIMALLTECNVSMNKVNNVICTVLQTFTGKIPQRLPSLAVKSRLLLEAKSVAQQQIVDAMLKDYDPTTMTGNTLHSDATSKFLKHYESFQVTLPDGNSMSIGLSEVGSGDADTLMNSFKTLINELAETCKLNEIDRDAKVAKLIASLTQCQTKVLLIQFLTVPWQILDQIYYLL